MHFAASDRTGQGHHKVRIVILRFRLAVAKVEHFIVSFQQYRGQVLLQFKTAVIGSHADAFRLG